MKIGYQLKTGDEITRLAETANVFSKGMGMAVLISLEKEINQLWGPPPLSQQNPIEVFGKIVCFCGTEFPFKDQFYGHGGKSLWCPNCRQEANIINSYAWDRDFDPPRLKELGGKAFMVALEWNNPGRSSRLAINDVMLGKPREERSADNRVPEATVVDSAPTQKNPAKFKVGETVEILAIPKQSIFVIETTGASMSQSSEILWPVLCACEYKATIAEVLGERRHVTERPGGGLWDDGVEFDYKVKFPGSDFSGGSSNLILTGIRQSWLQRVP